MSRRPLRLALVGLGYGAAYVEPILTTPAVELVALGARGSARAHEVAHALHVPLHTSVEGLVAARPDVAILAVPPDAALGLLRALLRAGCHVLCEFPLDGATAAEATRLAATHGVHFDVNAHFPHLRAARAFARRCARAGPPALVDVVCHERTLYPCLALLHRALGHAFRPARALPGVATGTFGPIPGVVRVTPLLSDEDDGSDVFFGHRVSVAWAAAPERPARTLTLLDTFGPVVASRSPPLATRVLVPPTARKDIDAERTAANTAVLRAFVRACRQPPERRAPSSAAAIARSYSETVALIDGA